MSDNISRKQEVSIQHQLTSFWAFLILTLITTILFSGTSDNPFKNILLSEYGVFENLTVLFYTVAAILSGRCILLEKSNNNTGKWLWAISGITFISAALLSEEILTDILNWTAHQLFDAPNPDASLTSIGFMAMLRIFAISAIICSLYFIVKYLRKIHVAISFLKRSPSFPFWILFTILIICSALINLNLFPKISRLEEWFEMNTSLAWMLGCMTVTTGRLTLAEKKGKSDEIEQPLKKLHFPPSLQKFFKEE